MLVLKKKTDVRLKGFFFFCESQRWQVCSMWSLSHLWAPCADLTLLKMYSFGLDPGAKHCAVWVSLRVSGWRSCCFHTKHPCCVVPICAHLCPEGHVRLKMRGGHTHCWCIALLFKRKLLSHWTTKIWSKIIGSVLKVNKQEDLKGRQLDTGVNNQGPGQS